jgi:hypothetical protein
MEQINTPDLFIVPVDHMEVNRDVVNDATSSRLAVPLDIEETPAAQQSRDHLALFRKTGNAIRAGLPIILRWPWTTDVVLENGKLVDAVNKFITAQSEISPMILVSILGKFHGK